MKFALYFILLIAGAFLLFWLRTFPFTEKKTKAPQQTAHANLLSRHVQSGNPHRSGRSSGMGYTYILNFQLDSGTQIELYAYETEFGALREGMSGTLTWQGNYFVRFDPDTET